METSIAILTQNLIAETETEIKGNNPKFNYRMLTPGSQIWIKCKIPDCSLRKMCSFGVRQYHCSKNYRKHQQNSISYHVEKGLTLEQSFCVKSIKVGSFFWSVFSCIWTEFKGLRSKYLYSVRIQENMDQKNLRV